MKTFLTLFILLFSSSVVAEDISDFQIEGMSIGDSLLDYFSEKEIKNNIMKEYYQGFQDQSFVAIEFYNHSSFKTYESVQFNIKRNDKNYKIYSITAANFYRDKIEECILKLDEISKEFSILFQNVEHGVLEKRSHFIDTTGQSYTLGFYYIFETNDAVVVECYDWSKKFTNEKGWIDKLSIALDTKEFSDWLHKQ